MSYFEIDQVFTAQDANEIKQLWIAASRPPGIEVGEIWLHNTTPKMLKRYIGNDQDEIIAIESWTIVRTDVNTIVNANTTWATGKKAVFGESSQLIIEYNVNTYPYLTANSSGLNIRNIYPGGKIYFRTTDSGNNNIYMLTLDGTSKTVDVVGDLNVEGAINTGKASVSLANDGVYNTNIPNTSQGTLILGSSEGGTNPAANGAKYHIGLDGSGPGNDGCKFEAGSSTCWSNTKDTADKVNVYSENGTIRIQNKRGSTYTISYGFFGLGL